MKPNRLLLAAIVAAALLAGCDRNGPAAPEPDELPATVVSRPACAISKIDGRQCCKICTAGKACGDGCIASWKVCRKGVGCACNFDEVLGECDTGDPVLDDPTIRAQLKLALELSGADNPDPSTRREIGGYVYRTASGALFLRDNHDPNATPCSMTLGGPTPEPGESVVAMWHTHPFRQGDLLPSNCNRPIGAHYDNIRSGGGSPAAWSFISNQGPFLEKIPMYIIDKKKVFRLDPDTPARLWRRNPHRFDRDTGRCEW